MNNLKSSAMIAGLALTFVAGHAAGAELIGWYKLDEPAGSTTAINSVNPGTADGSYMYGVALGQEGAPVPNAGTSARFDGVDDYMFVLQDIGVDTSLELHNQFSVEYWLKAEAVQYPWSTPIAKGDIARFDNEVLTHHIYADRSFCHAVWFAPTDTYANTVPVDEWLHVAVTHDTGQAARIYLNGSEMPLRREAHFAPAPNAADDFFVGTLGALFGDPRPQAGETFYHGLIDEVAIFDGLLTPAEILSHYNNGVPLEVDLDIKPGSWPNPLNPISKGVLPLAICGAEDFDVMTIDPETILVGDALGPLRWSYEDVATPFGGEPCEGHDLNGDGFMDLTLKFSNQELMSALGLDLLGGQTVPLALTGSLTDGTPLTGSDCVRVLTRGDGNMDGLVDGLDYIAWSNNYMTGATWGEGDYNDDGVVDGLDYVAWSNNYGTGYDLGAPVPEPATLVLLALGAAALMRRRRVTRS